MSNKKLIRFIVFSSIHYFPLIILWLVWVFSMGSSCLFYAFVSGVPILFAMWASYWVWIKYPSWKIRCIAIDFIWCLIPSPFLFEASGMGFGHGNIIPPPFQAYLILTIWTLFLLIFLQFIILPWTFFSMWLMRMADKKWFE
jgi:hypothetical protein